MTSLLLFLVLFSSANSMIHLSQHHPPCCHANHRVSQLLRTCLRNELKTVHPSTSKQPECESIKEIILLPSDNDDQMPMFPASSGICECGDLSKKCHYNAKCLQNSVENNSLESNIDQSLEYICVSRETITKLYQSSEDQSKHICDQFLESNNIETAIERPKNMGNKITSFDLYGRLFKKTTKMMATNSTEEPGRLMDFYKKLKKLSSSHKEQGNTHRNTNLSLNATSPHQTYNIKPASTYRSSTTKKHHQHPTHKQPKHPVTLNHQDKTPGTASQYNLKTKPELKKFYAWVSKNTKLQMDGRLPDKEVLRKLIRVYFDNQTKSSNDENVHAEFQKAEGNEASEMSAKDGDSFDEQSMFGSRNSPKRQADKYNSENYENEDGVKKEPTEPSNDSAVYDTFVNRQVLLWFNSLAEPRWIKSHINANAEKFSLYVILFVFLGVISTMGAVIYRLFFQVKVHKTYIIGKKTKEKEEPEDEEGNNNENEEKDKDVSDKKQQEGEEKFNSPGNWRTPESGSSTGDDRTLRDDDHGNLSNIERTDSRHVMCTIVSQERSLDEISQVEQRHHHDANNNKQTADDQAMSGQMVSSMLQQTSSPPLSAITNHSSSPPQSPNIRHHNQHQQPSLPSPPGSFMFEPPPPNDMNPILMDHSMVTVHPPKMSDHDPDNPDVNTLARRSRELY